MPTIGTCRTCASVLAVSTPTRRPVNSPGPDPHRDRRRPARSSTSLHASSCWSAGVTASCRARPATESRRHDLLLGPDRDARLRRGGLDPHHDHGAASRARGRARAPCPALGPRRARRPRPSIRRVSSSPVGILGRELDAEPVAAAGAPRTASPHSTRSTVLAVPELVQARDPRRPAPGPAGRRRRARRRGAPSTP